MNNATREAIELVYLVVLKGAFDPHKIGQALPSYAKMGTPVIFTAASSQHIKAAECLRDSLNTQPDIILSKVAGGHEIPKTGHRIRNNFYSPMHLLTKVPMETIVISSPEFLEKVVQPQKKALDFISAIDEVGTFQWCPKSHSTGMVYLEPVEEVDSSSNDDGLITIAIRAIRNYIRRFKLTLKNQIPFRALMAATGIHYNRAIMYNGMRAECEDYMESELMVQGGDQIEILP